MVYPSDELAVSLAHRAAELRRTVVEMIYCAQSGHPGRSLSAADLSPVPVVWVGLPDTFAETGPYEALLNRYGMSVEHIVSATKRAVALRRERMRA